MNYVEVIEKMAAMGPELASGKTAGGQSPRKFSLDAIRELLAELGRPELTFTSVLIAGTNGKGSTAATLAAIGTAAGLRTGLYTSPHLLRVNERMRVSAADGGGLEDISDDDFARVFTAVDDAANKLVDAGLLPKAVGFCYFAERGVELAVVEVGLGGRLDATNVVEPLVSIITDIGMDHMDYLGHTLGAIAGEKAGILREDGVLVTLSQHPEANAVIGEVAMAKNVRGVDAARCLPPARQVSGFRFEVAEGELPLERNRYELSIDGEVVRIDSPLAGQHQQRNIALAVAAAIELRTNHGFLIPNAAIEAGVKATNWVPSRHGHAPLLFDVAHNPAGAWTLRAALAQLPEDMPRTLIFSCLADKAIDEMAQVLLPLFDSTSGDPARARDHVILAPIQNPRAATVEELLAAAHKLDVPAHAAPHLPAALAQAEAITPAEGVIVATGSIFLVGELRALVMAEAVA